MSEEDLLLHEHADRPYQTYLSSLEQLQELRRFQGEPARFWMDCLRVLGAMTDASSGAILVHAKEPGTPWQLLAVSPQSLNGGEYAERLAGEVAPHLEKLAQQKAVSWQSAGERYCAVLLETGEQEGLCLAAFLLEPRSEISTKESVRRLMLARDVPAAYQALRIAEEAKSTVERIAGVLDLMVLLNEQKRFLTAAMTFCNEVSARLRCERVSLGWLNHGYMKLQATSHIDRFDRKSEAVHMLEAAMEEASDQNCEVGWPDDYGGGAVTRDHRSFARSNDTEHIFSLPLRVEQEAVAVCTCERKDRRFTEGEIRLLRLLCDQPARRLSDLKRWDRWFGARLVSALRRGLGRLVGFEHTWLKVLALLVTALAVFLVFGRIPYRITAPLTLKTDDVAILSAPFAGHIRSVNVRVGDRVHKGEELLALARTSLLLQEARIVAQMESYRSQVEKARATASLANMRIAQAREDAARAQYDLIRYHLSETVIRAPFSGVVVKGKLLGRVGLPVQQGQTLFTVARIAGLYAVLDVSEQDISKIPAVKSGKMALASRPGQLSAIDVTRVDPEAITKKKGNVFHVDCSFPNGPQSWWRPGMTGIAKLYVGRRSPLWIVTHRTIDFLRLRFW